MRFDLEGARQAGASDYEIAAFLANKSSFDFDGALKAGASEAQIAEFLATKAAPKADEPGVFARVGNWLNDTRKSMQDEANANQPAGYDDQMATFGASQANAETSLRRADAEKPLPDSAFKFGMDAPTSAKTKTDLANIGEYLLANRDRPELAGEALRKNGITDDIIKAVIPNVESAHQYRMGEAAQSYYEDKGFLPDRTENAAKRLRAQGFNEKEIGAIHESILSNLKANGIDLASLDRERSLAEVGGDTGRQVVQGAARMAAGLTWVADRVISGTDAGQGLLGGATKWLDRVGEEMEAGKTDTTRANVFAAHEGSEGFMGTVEGLVTNPTALADLAFSNVAMVVPGVVATRIASGARYAQVLAKTGDAAKAAAAASTAAQAAGLTMTGVMEGSDAGKQVWDATLKMPLARLAEESHAFKSMVASGVDPEEARREIAHKASALAFASQATLAMGASQLTGANRFQTKIFTGRSLREAFEAGGAGGMLGGILKTGLRESVEETIHEGGNQANVNFATKEFLDPNQDLREGVAESAAMGAVLGPVVAGGYGAMGAVTSEMSRDQRMQDQFVSDIDAMRFYEPALEQAAVDRLAPNRAQLAEVPRTSTQTEVRGAPIEAVLNATSVDEAIAAAADSAGTVIPPIATPAPAPQAEAPGSLNLATEQDEMLALLEQAMAAGVRPEDIVGPVEAPIPAAELPAPPMKPTAGQGYGRPMESGQPIEQAPTAMEQALRRAGVAPEQFAKDAQVSRERVAVQEAERAEALRQKLEQDAAASRARAQQSEKVAAVQPDNRAALLDLLDQAEPMSDQESDLFDKLKVATRFDVDARMSRGEMPVFATGKDTFATITESAQQPGKYQVTRYGPSGIFGDTQYNSVEEAIRDNNFSQKRMLSQADADAKFAESMKGEAEYQAKRSEAERLAAQASSQQPAPKPKKSRYKPDAALTGRATPVADELRAMSQDAGWAEIGGRMIRFPNGDVGRTEWKANAPWFQSGMEINPDTLAQHIEDVIAGRGVPVKSRRTIEAMAEWLDAQRTQKPLDEDSSAYDFQESFGDVIEDGSAMIVADWLDDAQDAMSEADAMRALGFTEQEIASATGQQAQAGARGAEATDAGTAASAGERGGEVGRAQEDAGSQEGLTLESYTPAELAQREAEQQARDEAEAKTNREADEKARKESERAEVRRRSEAAADTFELGQSADDNLSGQGGLQFSRGADSNPGQAADNPSITRDTLRESIASTMPSLSSAVDRMLERGDKGLKGGLVLIESANEQDIAEAFASKTGMPIEDAYKSLQFSVSPDGERQVMSANEVDADTEHIVVQEKPPVGLLESGLRGDTASDSQPTPPFAGGDQSIGQNAPDIKRSSNGAINGFFDPRSGITFMVGPNLTAETAPGVLLHEATHGKQRAGLDAQAQTLLGQTDSKLHPQATRDFLVRVNDRIEAAGETGNASEAAAYIVELAAIEGRQAGFSAIDGKFMDWVDNTLGKRIGNIVRDFVAMIRAWGLRNGVELSQVTVDDLVAIAKSNVKAMARGDVVTNSRNTGRMQSMSERNRVASEQAPDPAGDGMTGGATLITTEHPTLGLRVPVHVIADPSVRSPAYSIESGQTILRVPPVFARDKQFIRTNDENGYAINDLLWGMGDDIFVRTTPNASDYDHVKNGTHRGSKNHATGEDEGGLSVSREPAHAAGKFAYFVKGTVIGQGSDGEPLLDMASVSIVSERMSFSEAIGAINEARKSRERELGLTEQQSRALRTARDLDFSHLNKPTAPAGSGVKFSRGGAPVPPAPPSGPSFTAPTLPEGPVKAALDRIKYQVQDRFVDLKQVQEAIKTSGAVIRDEFNPYMLETLMHGKAAYRVQQFMETEINPVLEELRMAKIDMDRFEKYLHARHAKERNAEMAKRNPNQAELDAMIADAQRMLDQAQADLLAAEQANVGVGAAKQNAIRAEADLRAHKAIKPWSGTEADRQRLSGMSNDDALRIITAEHAGAQSPIMKRLAKKMDDFSARTRQEMAGYGLESVSATGAWDALYQHYVPLKRDMEESDLLGTTTGTGAGISIRGSMVKSATGSLRDVEHIFANIVAQREATIVRGEKNVVGKALYGLALENANDDMWAVIRPDMTEDQLRDELQRMGLTADEVDSFTRAPTTPTIDPNTGLVVRRVNPNYGKLDNAIVIRVAGQDRVILLSRTNDRAVRLAGALKNIDTDMGGGAGMIMRGFGPYTRYLAAINTQYNPIFGITNFTRDVQEALINLESTDIAGKQREVFGNIKSAIAGSWNWERGDKSHPWATIYEEFLADGGATGFRDQFADLTDRAQNIALEVGGYQMKDAKGVRQRLSVFRNRGLTKKFADLLSDYNTVLENGTRLAVYKTARDAGVSRAQAANIAKDITVNFNRKGARSAALASLYAFFNSAAQGIERQLRTISTPGVGKALVSGLLMAGVIEALIGIFAFGDDWDEIPVFERERNWILPVWPSDRSALGEMLGVTESGGNYIKIPKPLGFYYIPNLSRTMVEMSWFGDRIGERTVDMLLGVANAYNPVGSAADPVLAFSPTVFDPFIEQSRNKSGMGREIFRENFSEMDPTPGFTRAKQGTNALWVGMAEAVNLLTGGDQEVPGMWSPEPERFAHMFGVLTGGPGREIDKAISTAEGWITGKEVPPHRVPLFGRFYGEAGGNAMIRGKFLDAVKAINIAENSVKGKLDRDADVSDSDLDIASLIRYARRDQADISAINKEMNQTKDRERKKELEAEVVEIQRQFVEMYEEVRGDPETGLRGLLR